MRLAALSDTHGNIVALEAVMADLARQRPDGIVFLGDLSLRGPRPAECIQLLKATPLLATVRGNHDQCLGDEAWAPRNFREEFDLAVWQFHRQRVSEADRQWLINLPTTATLNLEGVQADLFHASPWSLDEVTWPWAPDEHLEKLCVNQTSRLILFGHVHRAFVRYAAGRTVVNTGSVGLPFDGDNRASYSMIDIEAGNIAVQSRRIAYDVEQAVQQARESMPYPEVVERAWRTGRFPF